MTRYKARLLALDRAEAAGLDPNAADAVVHRALEIFHEEFTVREWLQFVDEEIQRHAQP